VRSDGALTVMVINKVATGNALTLNVLHFASGAAAQVWQLGASNSIARLADAPLAGGLLNNPGAGAKHHAVRDSSRRQARGA